MHVTAAMHCVLRKMTCMPCVMSKALSTFVHV
jgi:hypothetical protein